MKSEKKVGLEYVVTTAKSDFSKGTRRVFKVNCVEDLLKVELYYIYAVMAMQFPDLYFNGKKLSFGEDEVAKAEYAALKKNLEIDADFQSWNDRFDRLFNQYVDGLKKIYQVDEYSPEFITMQKIVVELSAVLNVKPEQIVTNFCTKDGIKEIEGSILGIEYTDELRSKVDAVLAKYFRKAA